MRNEFNKIGNVEFLNIFLVFYYKKYDFVSSFRYIKTLLSEKEDIIISKFLENYDLDKIYSILFKEAKNRGLNSSDSSFTLINDEDFLKWQERMRNTPTFIREVRSTNYLGDRKLLNAFDFSTLDYPVREACRILNDKGYVTYWSSANYEDVICRKGQIIYGKNIAYILIDSTNLNSNLKEKLFLNKDIELWGKALNHCENGNYYGIYVEIESLDTLCQQVSDLLVLKALELPVLEEKWRMKK